MRRLALPIILLASLALTGCSTASSPATTPASAAQPTGTDRTAELRSTLSADLAQFLTSAVEVEPGRITVATTVIDPRSGKGGAAAQAAIAICQSAVALTGTTYVSVQESDGSTFVLYGHPTYGNTCTEV
ncbi:hypothetical protein QN345_00415 [Cryobacterium sp. 10I1]|uniref:hypothetical protein n=1 Tax=Cryobacterium sp. 10I1 TaxID=3048578 RepID=UPI002B2392D8|nr:hypothetical protein [Cryobacterium sp. 10I1]MEB0303802.1 hypothetical protein [Cryobacterium sp. 10I1]